MLSTIPRDTPTNWTALATGAAAATSGIDALRGRGPAPRQQLRDIVETVVTNRDADRRLFREKRRALLMLVGKLGRR